MLRDSHVHSECYRPWSWCTGDKFFGEYIWTHYLDIVSNILAFDTYVGFTSSVWLVNSGAWESLCNSWLCLQMPMYVALKFGQWGHVIPHNLESLCVWNLFEWKTWACSKLRFQERLHMFTIKCHMNLYRLMFLFSGNFLFKILLLLFVYVCWAGGFIKMVFPQIMK